MPSTIHGSASVTWLSRVTVNRRRSNPAERRIVAAGIVPSTMMTARLFMWLGVAVVEAAIVMLLLPANAYVDVPGQEVKNFYSCGGVIYPIVEPHEEPGVAACKDENADMLRNSGGVAVRAVPSCWWAAGSGAGRCPVASGSSPGQRQRVRKCAELLALVARHLAPHAWSRPIHGSSARSSTTRVALSAPDEDVRVRSCPAWKDVH